MTNLNLKPVILVGIVMVLTRFVGAQSPQPKIRKIASIPGADIEGVVRLENGRLPRGNGVTSYSVDIDEAVRLPNGTVVLYTVGDCIIAYDLKTKRSMLVTLGFDNSLSISRSGNRIAFGRGSDDATTGYIWTMPIDPKTGLAAGPAKRVSRSAGDCPSISPDGNLIAFARNRDGNSSVQDLALVATADGTERILAKYGKGLCNLSWSADGNWIFLRRRDTSVSIERVPAAGGQSESMISNLSNFEGSINGQIAFYRPDTRAQSEGRMAYVTPSGVRSEFRVLPESHGDMRSAQSLLIRTMSSAATHVLNLADGRQRDLLPGIQMSRCPVWSPDSRRFALLLDSTGGRSQLAVINADGSNLRRYPITLPDTTSIHWSPNGQMLGYYNDGAVPATIQVMETATGKVSTVFSAPDVAWFDFMWRPDGKSIVLVKGFVQSGKRHREVYEAALDGTARKLRDIDNEFPFGHLISDQVMLLGADGDLGNRYAITPSVGGATRKVKEGTNRVGAPSVSNDGEWLLFLLGKTTPITSVELVAISGVSSRVLNLPFKVVGGYWTPPLDPPFDADGRHIILFGKTPGESTSEIFLVPLDGTPPRVLATLPGTVYKSRLALSPDGSSLVYTLQGSPISTIYDLDVSPILRSIGKH